MMKLLATGCGIAIGMQLLLAAPAEADHRRHWFYDNYQNYDGEAFDYRRRPRIYQRRNFDVEFAHPPRQLEYDPYADEEYIVNRRRQDSYPWRERRIRYDLSKRQHELRQRRRVSAPPLPRRKPSTLPAVEENIEFSALEKPARVLQDKPASRTRKTATPAPLSCDEARGIVAGFGFSDIQPTSCQGATYSFAAKRDGHPFAISLSSSSGELTQVKRQ